MGPLSPLGTPPPSPHNPSSSLSLFLSLSLSLSHSLLFFCNLVVGYFLCFGVRNVNCVTNDCNEQARTSANFRNNWKLFLLLLLLSRARDSFSLSLSLSLCLSFFLSRFPPPPPSGPSIPMILIMIDLCYHGCG